MSTRTLQFWATRWCVLIVPYTATAALLLLALAKVETAAIRGGWQKPPDSASFYFLAFPLCITVGAVMLVLVEQTAMDPRLRSRMVWTAVATGVVTGIILLILGIFAVSRAAIIVVGTFARIPGIFLLLWQLSPSNDSTRMIALKAAVGTFAQSGIETSTFWFSAGYTSITEFPEVSGVVQVVGAAGMFMTSVVLQRLQVVWLMSVSRQFRVDSRRRLVQKSRPIDLEFTEGSAGDVGGSLPSVESGDGSDALKKITIIQFLAHIMILSVFQVVPAVTILRISESDEWIFVLFLLGWLCLNPLIDVLACVIRFSWSLLHPGNQRVSFRAIAQDALQERPDLYSKFHTYLANQSGLATGIITTVFFFCNDTPIQQLSPSCAFRLRIINVQHTAIRGGFMLFGAIVADSLYFGRQLWLQRKEGRAARKIHSMIDVGDSGEILRTSVSDDDGTWEPTVFSGWLAAVGGGAAAAGFSCCSIAVLRGLLGGSGCSPT
ncbi:hypothetical protein DFJ73DRAFT_829242 [Zopfochytrium polystomum]|nr:hypothetical protein DFJ73DRAFT_829242 [Zopfochytrium polystomum]